MEGGRPVIEGLVLDRGKLAEVVVVAVLLAFGVNLIAAAALPSEWWTHQSH